MTEESKTYTVIPPNEPFMNKSYTEWVEEWSSWFYQVNPDRNNNGDVVFLRGMPLSSEGYTGEGNVMVGNDALEITTKQRILVPVVTSNYVADESETSEWLYGMVRSHISAGDNPPYKSQLRINGQSIDDNDDKVIHLGKYLVETPIFMIGIPDSTSGKSLKDLMETPIKSSGFFPSVTKGYFVMLKLEANEEGYYIESYATGAPTAYGPYHTSFLYHIKVREPLEERRANIPPSRLTSNIIVKLREKVKNGELKEQEFRKVEAWMKNSIPDIDSGFREI